MTTETIVSLACQFTQTAPANAIPADTALCPSAAGQPIFDTPLLGFADASDAYFSSLESNGSGAIANPLDWLPGAKTVISFFLPFTKAIIQSNIAGSDPSPEWLHGRIEGQKFIGQLGLHLQEALEQTGASVVIPAQDARFRADSAAGRSNWSERHVAYACGLGTFGLSHGLITQRGIAGRFGSLVTTLALPATPRPYTGIYDYCTQCKACVRRCPVSAIDPVTGKTHIPCRDYNNAMHQKYTPYMGCGKCQAGVPCAFHIPTKNKQGMQ